MKWRDAIAPIFGFAIAMTPSARVCAQRAGIDYPTPEQIGRLPRYVPGPGVQVISPAPLPLARRQAAQLAAPNATPVAPMSTIPKVPPHPGAPAIGSQIPLDPFVGHPRPDTVNNVQRLENMPAQLSHPTVSQARGQ